MAANLNDRLPSSEGAPLLFGFASLPEAQPASWSITFFLARDLKLIKPDDYEKLAQQTTEIKRMLTAFVQKLTAEG